MPSLRRRAALVLTLVGFSAGGLASGCEGDEGTVTSVYAVPEDLAELSEATYFDHPYPSDLRRIGGKVRLAGYPNPRAVPLLAEYIGYMDGRLDGFSPVAGGFLRFDGALDPASLPDPGEAQDPSASVQLVDVDPASPERGKRWPIYVTFRAEAGVYWPANTLAFGPVPGFPLRFENRYALVVTDAVAGASGERVVAPAALREVLGIETPSTDATRTLRDAVEPDVAYLATQGIAKERVVHLAVFTTNDPTREFMAAAAAMPSAVPPPAANESAWQAFEDAPGFDEYLGSYGPSPNYQAGAIPFKTFGSGGDFVLDAGGTPVVQNTFDARFSLTVPRADACPMPEAGYPIALYAHGTGGDFQTFVRDGTARELAARCIATMGVDQIFHGARPGAPDTDAETQILFFNFNNVEAARTNVRQSGLDEIQRARLFTEGGLTIPASVSLTGSEIRFDPAKILFFGHSQGSLNGPLFLAGSDATRGGVLSGASAVIQITLLEKTKPEPSVAFLVKAIFLQLVAEEQDEVALLYPPMTLAQTIIDPVDPVNYARYLVREPVVGGPKSIYMSEGVGPDGVGDSYAPPRGCEALAIAIGLPVMEPVVHEPVDAAWGGLDRVSIPAGGLSGNLAGGLASGVLAQWAPQGDDGHFVVFDVPGATAQSSDFMRALADDPRGRVPAP